MAVAWSFYSARRRVSIKQYVERRKLGSYDEFVADLAQRGIGAPGKEQYTTEMGKRPPLSIQPTPLKSVAQKSKPKSKPKSTRRLSKKTKATLPVSEADEAREAVNSEYSDKDKKQ